MFTWTRAAAPVLIDVVRNADTDPARDLAAAADEHAGRLLVGRFAADRPIVVDMVENVTITAFPTLLLYRDRVEVRRATDLQSRAALLRDLGGLLG